MAVEAAAVGEVVVEVVLVGAAAVVLVEGVEAASAEAPVPLVHLGDPLVVAVLVGAEVPMVVRGQPLVVVILIGAAM